MRKNKVRWRKLWRDYRNDVAIFEQYGVATPYGGYQTDEFYAVRQKVLALVAAKRLRELGYNFEIELPSIAGYGSMYPGSDMMDVLTGDYAMEEDQSFVAFISYLECFGWSMCVITPADIESSEPAELVRKLALNGAGQKDVMGILEDMQEESDLELVVLKNERVGKVIEYAEHNKAFKASRQYRMFKEMLSYCAMPLYYYLTDGHVEDVADGVFYSTFQVGYSYGWDAYCHCSIVSAATPLRAMHLERFISALECAYPGIMERNTADAAEVVA